MLTLLSNSIGVFIHTLTNRLRSNSPILSVIFHELELNCETIVQQ